VTTKAADYPAEAPVAAGAAAALVATATGERPDEHDRARHSQDPRQTQRFERTAQQRTTIRTVIFHVLAPSFASKLRLTSNLTSQENPGRRPSPAKRR
jgi:hypothetical protein